MKDYFEYLPDNAICDAWQCTATSIGLATIAPGAPYPPSRHPDDHLFNQSRGRILQAYQIILISAGSGYLETSATKDSLHIHEGMAFVLFPGVWHRYAPDPQTGWTEHWIECQGDAFDAMLEKKLLRADQPVFHADVEMMTVFNSVHNLAVAGALEYQPVISTLGLQLLAILCRQIPLSHKQSSDLVDSAKLLMMRRAGMDHSVEAIARELGISYSYFRKLFREHTGRSAKSFQMDIRIRRACDLLSNSDQSIKAIAGILGFSSAFHFSIQFKQRMGQSPSEYRSLQAKDVYCGP